MKETLGIGSEQLPDKTGVTVPFATFSIAGLIMRGRNQYEVAFEVQDNDLIEEIFGEPVRSYYGADVAQSFFANTDSATLWVKSAVGNTGAVIDAVVANKTISDAGGAPSIRIEAAYKSNVAYGANGNNVGYVLTKGNRYNTVLTAIVAIAAEEAHVPGIGDIKVGDIVEFVTTGGNVYKKITAIDEAESKIKWVGAFHATYTGAIGDAVNVLGLRVQTFKKSPTTGRLEEVEKEKGGVYCSFNADDSDTYIENVHKENIALKITDLQSTSTLDDKFPITATIAYLENGADGTAPTTVSTMMFGNVDCFESTNIRLITCSDNFDQAFFNALEIEMGKRAKEDTPIVIPNCPKNMTEEEMISLGRGNQRSERVYQVPVFTWLTVNDKFATSTTAPDREIPSVGATTGDWIRCGENYGYHEIPAQQKCPIRGATGVVAPKEFTNIERTNIAEAGVNIIQKIEGKGIIIRNFRTFSTAKGWIYGGVLMMSNFINISVMDSSSPEMGGPNTSEKVKRQEGAVKRFLHDLYLKGTNGSVVEGETFGRVTVDGVLQDEEQLYQLNMDPTINTQDVLQDGKRYIKIHFQIVSPLEILRVGIGIQTGLRSST